jgi:pilus assembly protein CpaF
MLGKKRNQSVFLEAETSPAARALEEEVPVPKACTKEETDMAEPKEAVVVANLEEIEHKKRDVLRTHDLFFSAEDDSKDFSAVLRDVQEHISAKYSTLLTSGNTEEVKETHQKVYHQICAGQPGGSQGNDKSAACR